MANFCRMSPTIKIRKGDKIKEEDSKLFRDIKDAVKDNDTAWNMWGYTKTTKFKDKYKDKVSYDELGEVTFPSLVKALGWEKIYNEEKSIDRVARDYGFANTVFYNVDTTINKINDFNSKEDRFVAVSEKTDDGYKIKVLQRNGVNMEKARSQSYNHELTKEIISLLNTLGFDVSWVSNPDFNGLFDPENAELHDGLVTIIRIARGEIGEEALPEEFSHLVIEGLTAHPLVQRLMNSINQEQIVEVLGDKYEEYARKYDNDGTRLKKEVAGKMLAQYITKQGSISEPVMRQKRPLLSRIWNWIKEIFGKITGNQLDVMRNRAYDSIQGIYNIIASDNIVELLDKQAVLSADNLYQLDEKYNTLEKVDVAGKTIVAKLRKMETMEGKDTKESTKRLAELQRNPDQHFENIKLFLGDAIRRLKNENKKIGKLKKQVSMLDKHKLNDLREINKIAKVVREIDTFTQGYYDIISNIATFDQDENFEMLGGISERGANELASLGSEILLALNSFVKWSAGVKRNIVYNAVRTQYRHDQIRNIGNKRDEIMSLKEILDHADRDINFVDRWFTAMSDADDALLTLMDGLVKNQKYEREIDSEDWRTQIAYQDKKLRDAGFSSDFMYERDEAGVPTGRIISPYDWISYRKDYKEKIAELRKELDENKINSTQYRELLRRWKGARLVRVYVDPEVDKLYREKGLNEVKREHPDAIYEMMPDPKIYSRSTDLIESLAPAQKEYYEWMMNTKRTMMSKIPHRGQGIYKTINISKDFIEGILDNTTGDPSKATLEHYKKQFVRRPDDIGFGTDDNFPRVIEGIIRNNKNDSLKAANEIIETLDASVDEDIVAILNPKKIQEIINRHKNDIKVKDYTNVVDEIIKNITGENFYIVDTDFAGNVIQRLPIYYTRPLKDMRMLSTDFSGAMVAYSSMAINYEKMNEVVDILEVGRNYIKKRDVRENEGDKPLISQFSALGEAFRHYVVKSGNKTNIAGRMDDFMASNVYEQRKKDKAVWRVPFTDINLDVAKTLDTIKDYTGLLGLGFNVFSAISNVTVGKLQQWIEGFAGEYFNLKDYAKGVAEYSRLLPGYLAEVGSPLKKNKLSLLIAMFDPMGDYYESLRNPNYSKSMTARILGNGILAYIGMNAGEHALHCQTMIAMLEHIKLEDKNGNKISFYDALEIREVNGIARLEIKEGLSYRRDLIGTDKSNKKEYGKPIRDENGKIKTELVPLKNIHDNVTRRYIIKVKRRIRKVNDSLNGAFNVDDKGAIHRRVLGRLLMQYRQWMVAHYERRFARAHYDNDLEQWREGFYITVVNMTRQIYFDNKKGELNFASLEAQMSEHEKANLRRAFAEVSLFFMLMTLCKLGGHVKDRDRNWLDKMVLYQLHRMYLDTGASMPFNGEFFSNIFTLLQSPAASIDTFENLTKVLQLWDMLDEVQSGRYQGWSVWEKNVYQLVPALDKVSKAYYFDDSMFSIFDKGA